MLLNAIFDFRGYSAHTLWAEISFMDPRLEHALHLESTYNGKSYSLISSNPYVSGPSDGFIPGGMDLNIGFAPVPSTYTVHCFSYNNVAEAQDAKVAFQNMVHNINTLRIVDNRPGRFRHLPPDPPTRDQLLQAFDSLISTASGCECGSAKVGSNRHSTWCPKFKGQP